MNATVQLPREDAFWPGFYEAMLVKKLLLTSFIAVAITGIQQPVRAAPLDLELTVVPDSTLTLFATVAAGLVTSQVVFDIDGTVDATLFDPINGSLTNETSGIRFKDSDLDLSTEDISFFLGFLGNVEGTFSGMEINGLQSNANVPLTSQTSASPFTYSFDPGGGSSTNGSIDEGSFTFFGIGPVAVETLFGMPGEGLLDFASSPVSISLESLGQVGSFTQEVTTAPFPLPVPLTTIAIVDVTTVIPISFSATFENNVNSDWPFSVEFSGSITATGQYLIVPEPSSLILLCVAAVGLLPLWRSIRADSS